MRRGFHQRNRTTQMYITRWAIYSSYNRGTISRLFRVNPHSLVRSKSGTNPRPRDWIPHLMYKMPWKFEWSRRFEIMDSWRVLRRELK